MRLAIVGFGPRGLGALEALVARWGEGALAVDIFEPGPHPGAGPNFSPKEHLSCLLNLPLRDVDLPRPEGFEFPTFANWSSESDENRFLPRACLGQYLLARFDALNRSLPDAISVTVIPESVASLDLSGGSCRVVAEVTHDGYDAVLLTLGQPETAADPQLSRWIEHADTHGLACLDAYPTEHILAAADGWTEKTVAIRGLGLSTLDILSLLTAGRGGVLEQGRYRPSGREPKSILPFSLDGTAPAPKPLTAALASRFEVTPGETDAFTTRLSEALAMGDGEEAAQHLAYALKLPVMRICGEDASSWLERELSEPGTQRDDDPVAALHHDIAIATGERPPSVGYSAGQVWRGWQDAMREQFRTTPAAPEVRMAVVGFDAALKRYSYGPPVTDARLLAALIEADIVRLTLADDPKISLTPKGWDFCGAQTAHVMINAVLPPAALGSLEEPLIQKLHGEGIITAISDKGGIRTAWDGSLVSDDGERIGTVSLLGRLATGSVVGSDSIHDCFGGSSAAWASSIVAQSR